MVSKFLFNSGQISNLRCFSFSLTYSHDNNRLYVAYVDGNVVIWEKCIPKKHRNPNLSLIYAIY